MSELPNVQPGRDTLEFTGERFTPECVREIWYEHWHRYAFALSFADGKRVLDAACGEGYGSALLATRAREVLGLDIADSAVAHARTRYATQTNLRFEEGDCTALNLPAASIDLAVSFETLEHVAEQQALIAGFARVLTADGIFIVSSPDKHSYSDVSGFRNEFHVRELYRDELLALLKPHFPYVRLYGQKLLFQSVIWPADGTLERAQASTVQQATTQVQSGLIYEPLYFIAVCSKQPLPAMLPDLALFGDSEESLYTHYNHEVRKNMAAGQRLMELEAGLAAMRSERDELASIVAKLTRAPGFGDPVSLPAQASWWRRWLRNKNR